MDTADLSIDPDGDVIFVLSSGCFLQQGPDRFCVVPLLEKPHPRKQLPLSVSFPKKTVRVASGHLKLSSSVFKAMLTGRTYEGSTLRDSGFVRIPLPDDYPDGLLIILYIIHCKFKLMPEKITPSLLMQVVLLADKYDLVDVLVPFAQKWLADVQAYKPWFRGAENLEWITIFKVLGAVPEFMNLTRMELEESAEELSTLELPISKVTDYIHLSRVKVLTWIFYHLQKIINDLLPSDPTSQPQCSGPCDVMTLGSLQRELKIQGLYPFPQDPFPGIRISEVLHTMTWIRLP